MWGRKYSSAKKYKKVHFESYSHLVVAKDYKKNFKLQFYDSFNLYAHQQLALTLPGLEVFFSGWAKVVVHPVIHLSMACRYVH